MTGAPRQRIIAAICLVALLAAVSPAAAQWSLPRLGGEAPLDQAAIASGAGDRGRLDHLVAARPQHRRAPQPYPREWGDRARVVSVVFQESPEAVEGFLEGKKLAVPVFLDSGNAEFSKRYNVTQVPRLLVFKDGVTAVNVNLTDDPDPLISGALE